MRGDVLIMTHIRERERERDRGKKQKWKCTLKWQSSRKRQCVSAGQGVKSTPSPRSFSANPVAKIVSSDKVVIVFA